MAYLTIQEPQLAPTEVFLMLMFYKSWITSTLVHTFVASTMIMMNLIVLLFIIKIVGFIIKASSDLYIVLEGLYIPHIFMNWSMRVDNKKANFFDKVQVFIVTTIGFLVVIFFGDGALLRILLIGYSCFVLLQAVDLSLVYDKVPEAVDGSTFIYSEQEIWSEGMPLCT